MKKLMKLLVIGSGGREHALAWKLAQSQNVLKVYVAPGNAGTALEQRLENVSISVGDIEKLADFAENNSVAFTVVGPEGPLDAGIVDVFHARGLKIFGPTWAAAQLESSKDFAKRFMVRHHIPTAPYEVFGPDDDISRCVKHCDFPIVIKADGLAAGKGVVVCYTVAEAHAAIEKISALPDDAGKNIIVEKFIDGEEASFMVISDGQHVYALATSQDHKRLLDNDKGSNTGGTGAYSPAPVVTLERHHQIMRDIVFPTIQGMHDEKMPFVGFLYVGIIIDKQGHIWVLEYNVRLGDPETQPLVLRLTSDLCPLIDHAISGTLDLAPYPEWDPRPALGVVLMAKGYPDAPEKGTVITGLPENAPDCKVFHAGTAVVGGNVVTSGGRVLCVTALGDGFADAQRQAYEMARKIRFAGMQYRSDIGHRAISR